MLHSKKLRWRLRIWRTYIIFFAIFLRYQLGCELEDGDEESETSSSEEDTLDCAGSPDTDDSAGGCNREDDTTFDDDVDGSPGCAPDSTEEPEPSGCNNESSDDSGCAGSRYEADPTAPRDERPYEVYDPGCAGCSNRHVVVDPAAGRNIDGPPPAPPRYDTGVGTDTEPEPDVRDSDPDADDACGDASDCSSDSQCGARETCEQGCCTPAACHPCATAGAVCLCESDSTEELFCDPAAEQCRSRCAAGQWDRLTDASCRPGEFCVPNDGFTDSYPGRLDDSSPLDGICREDACRSVFLLAAEGDALDLDACAQTSTMACDADTCACLPDSSGRLACVPGGSSALEQPCEDLDDCELGLVCYERVCVRPCSVTADTCPSPTECAPVFDTNAAAHPGVCALRCNPDDERACVTGTTCRPMPIYGADTIWLCTEDGSAGPQAPCAAHADCGTGLICAPLTGRCEVPCDPSAGDACEVGVCADSGLGGAGYCATRCTAGGNECPGDAVCRPVYVGDDPLDAGGVCVPGPTLSGAPCASPGPGSAGCAAAEACAGETGAGACVTTCAPYLGFECPDGDWCDVTSAVRGEAAGVCRSTAPPSTLSAMCDEPNTPCANGGWCTASGNSTTCLPYCRTGSDDCDAIPGTTCTLLEAESPAIAPWSGVCTASE